MRNFAFLLLASLLFSTAAHADIKFATWNIYWLGDGQGNDKSKRIAAEYKTLADYAKKLDADIIAVQEVENSAALEKLFPGSEYNIEMSQRNNSQRTGFAIRKGIQYSRLPDYEDLNVSGGLRYGTVISVRHDGKDIAIMAVHLKSGCFEKDLDQPAGDACVKLEKQIVPLKSWIDGQVSAGTPFVMLGDFNRRMDKAGDDLWREIGGTGAVRANATHKPKCYGGKFKEYIDHLIVGPQLAGSIIPGSFSEMIYSEGYGGYKKLSDHCPLSFMMTDNVNN